MLRPQDTATRERKSLDGLWRFAFDAEGVGRAAEWWNGPLPNPHEVAVPASYNDLFADPAARDHVGDVWYQTIVRVPAGWQGERIVLRFDAATHRAVVWVNEHAGRRARGRLHALRGRRQRARRPRRASPRHRGRQQRAELAVDPARLRRGDGGREAHPVLPRLLQLRRAAPLGLAVQHPGRARQRRHGRHGVGRFARHGRVPRGGHECRRPRGPRRAAGRRGRGSRPRRRFERRPDRGRRAPLEARRGLPLRAGRRARRG